MTKRPPHTLPYTTHQWVGELLYQARNTLVYVSVVLGNSYPKGVMTFCGHRVSCDRIYTCIDKARSDLDDALFAEHAHGPQGSNRALLRVYYPESPDWFKRMPHDPSSAGHRPRVRRKWQLTWQDHLALAEMLFQSWEMVAEAWGITLRAYGAPARPNRLLETIVPSGTGFSVLQSWCQDRMHDAETRGLMQWPPDLERDLYTNAKQYFPLWSSRFAPTLSPMEIPA